MKKIIPTTLTILLLLFANSAMAERGSERGNRDGYASQGKRIEQRLNTRGDRIEQHFDRKADRAHEKGKYRQARHFENKGKQINRHLDRKGQQIHKRFEHRGDYRRDNHLRYRSYPRVAYPVKSYRHPNTHVSVLIQQPGLLFGWGIHR
ncbi:MAG: hypothetical protein ACSLFC_08540 [Desulfuromonadales bacterium]